MSTDLQQLAARLGPSEPLTKEVFADRLKRARAALGLTQREMADKTGISYASLKDYEVAKAFPGSEALLAVLRVGVNANWLLSGIGSVLLADLIGWREKPSPSSADYVEIPVLGVQVAAGEGLLVDEENVVGNRAFNREWISRDLRMNPKDLRLVAVYGDSMWPTLADGDMVMVNMKETRLWRDDIYVLREDDAVMVKRLQRLPVGGFKVISDNPAYPAVTVLPAQAEDRKMAIVGRVVWWARTNVR